MKKILSADYNLAEMYFQILNPLSDGVKLYLLKMLTDSIVVKSDTEDENSSLSSLFGVWSDSPDMDGIEDFIKNSRTNGNLRNIISL